MSDYAVIQPDGTTYMRNGEWREEVGPEGPNHVTLHPALDMAAWVNDCGLLFPDRYPRNITGSVVLACLGAHVQPYAGPVVLTGWHQCASCDPDARPLAPEDVDYLPRLVRDVGRALAGLGPAEPDDGWWQGWSGAVRQAACIARGGGVPVIRILTDGAGGAS